MGRRSFRRMWYAAAALLSLPFIGVGYAVANGNLFGAEVELFLPAPGTVSTVIRTAAEPEPRMVSTAAPRLFYKNGKGPRADRFAVSRFTAGAASDHGEPRRYAPFLECRGLGEGRARRGCRQTRLARRFGAAGP